jgi:protein TonB
MFARYLSIFPAGIAITASLLWAMQFLIANSEVMTGDSRVRLPTFLTRTIVDSAVKRIEPKIELPAKPQTPPFLKPAVDPRSEITGIAVPAKAPSAPDPFSGRLTLTRADNALISIVEVRPEYPLAATGRGLEGYVVVTFDVTASGTVDNVVVLESSSNVFNQAAVKAAYRSRYKAPTVDGVPQPVRGLRKLYRFQLTNE